MEFRKLTSGMLEFRLGHDPDIDPDWFVAHLTDIISYDPDGCFALCDGDKVVGMITSTTYQEVAWLGWLFVLEDYRKGGLGAKLTSPTRSTKNSTGISATTGPPPLNGSI